jgi:hypothetical protein
MAFVYFLERLGNFAIKFHRDEEVWLKKKNSGSQEGQDLG